MLLVYCLIYMGIASSQPVEGFVSMQDRPGFFDGIRQTFTKLVPSSLRRMCSDKEPEDCSTPSEELFYDIVDSEALLEQLQISGLDTDKLRREDFTFVDRSFVLPQQLDSSLKQVLLLHRHGDRTPIEFQPGDKLSNESFWSFHGYAQLTNRGKARLNLLGRLIRGRYNQFMGGSVNKNHRVTRASGSLRCIESAETFLSGFLSLDIEKSPDARKLAWDKGSDILAQLWQPASIYSVPPSIDGMLAESASCGTLTNEYEKVIEQSEFVQNLYKEYAHEVQVFREVYEFNIDRFYKWFWASSQLEVERSYFPHKMDPRMLAIYDRVQEVGNLAMRAYFSTTNSRRFRLGLLLTDYIENMKKMRDSDQPDDGRIASPKRFVHYSAHDMNIVALLGTLDLWDEFPFRPEYASTFIIELHHEVGEWYLKFLYMPRVPDVLTELDYKKCSAGHPLGRCTLERFEQLMRPYAIPSWQSWMSECRNDFAQINPYKLSP